jgi:hypothetical protein
MVLWDQITYPAVDRDACKDLQVTQPFQACNKLGLLRVRRRCKLGTLGLPLTWQARRWILRVMGSMFSESPSVDNAGREGMLLTVIW